LIKQVVRFSLNESISELFLEGNLVIPDNAIGMVIFAHGSGSGKESPRNKKIASIFNRMSLSTLLIDLLTNAENEMDLRAQKIEYKIPGLVLNKFNIKLLTERLLIVTKWLDNSKSLPIKNIGYFGSSTGAPATFLAASKLLKTVDKDGAHENNIKAIVSRGGRTDLITDTNILKHMNIPSLFIVGSKDDQIIKINKKTMSEFNPLTESKMEIIDGASHLFEEEGKIESVADIAGNWFLKFLQIPN
jgi:putative phosphoribosyl transferase